MSQKWRRVKRWDDEHLRGPLLPVKWGLRTLSSIPLAVVTLVGIAVYGTLASVPIGLLAQIPTWTVYVGTLLAALIIGAFVPVGLALRGLRQVGVSGSWRYATGLLGLLGLGIGVFMLWLRFAWPHLRWDAATSEGFMLFPGFVQAYASTTLRRLPGFEMSELEFYGWWPMKALLLLLVVNLVVATARRIEFIFVNIGVLTVHTGIVIMALGSVLYTNLKLEGDTVLLAGRADGSGHPTLGPFEAGFYDNTDVALWVSQHGGRQQRPLAGVPRYNDYNLDAAWPAGARKDDPTEEASDGGRSLRLPVPAGVSAVGGAVDADLQFEVAGYASYADRVENGLVRLDPSSPGAAQGGFFAREVALLVTPPASHGAAEETSELSGSLIPSLPAHRVAQMFENLIGIEHTLAMSEERWEDLTTPAPEGTAPSHLLIVEVPGRGLREVIPVPAGGIASATVGGYSISLQSISPAPPFPIITPGYEGATSSLAVVRIDPPGDDTPAFQRWIYHRFPELNQDLHPSPDGGRPRRTDAGTDIRIGYVDLSKIQVYLDERPGGSVRAAARLPGGRLVVDEQLAEGELLEVDPRIKVRLDAKDGPFAHAPTPRIVPPAERQKDAIGTHRNAMLAVRIFSDESSWQKVVWLPFVQYINVGMQGETNVPLPDGRQINLAFGRVKHGFPGFALALQDFEMIPYPHSDVPRDYRSDLLVWAAWDEEGAPARGEANHMSASTSLNEPLQIRVPFRPHPEAPLVANLVGHALRAVAPVQFKFSQAGWDRDGWMRSKAEAEAGMRPRPIAGWTILGVGNNPGIYIIAFGAVLTCIGVPWAFYVKPLLVKRRKKKLQTQLRATGAAANRQPQPAEVNA